MFNLLCIFLTLFIGLLQQTNGFNILNRRINISHYNNGPTLNRATIATGTTKESQKTIIIKKWSRRNYSSSNELIKLRMGLFDFLTKRDGDFIKLEDTKDVYGPGPIIILYNVPRGITTDEISDMIEDGAPNTFNKGVTIKRLAPPSSSEIEDSSSSTLLNKQVSDALNDIQSSKSNDDDEEEDAKLSSSYSIDTSTIDNTAATTKTSSSPAVLLFSGFYDKEMISTYNIIGQEIYSETNGITSTACAKVVPNAMSKPLKQVFDEISSDHLDAISQ